MAAKHEVFGHFNFYIKEGGVSMNQMELLNKTAEKTGCHINEIEKVYQALLETMFSAVSTGENINFGSDFGGFIVKRRDYKLPDNSPRTQKPSRYQVTFRPSGELKKILKI